MYCCKHCKKPVYWWRGVNCWMHRGSDYVWCSGSNGEKRVEPLVDVLYVWETEEL
jgi:hypothetical protein